MSTGAGASARGDEEMEEHEEMEQDSTSNVQMVAGQGISITGMRICTYTTIACGNFEKK